MTRTLTALVLGLVFGVTATLLLRPSHRPWSLTEKCHIRTAAYR